MEIEDPGGRTVSAGVGPMMVAICVLKSGGPYDAEDVQRLSNSIIDCSDFRFRCFSDVDVPGVVCYPLEDDLFGWWSKMEIYRERDWGERVERLVYFDLDTIIKDDINFLKELNETDDTYALEDWYHPTRTVNSSIVSFRPNSLAYLYKMFSLAPRRYIADGSRGMDNWGDQGFLSNNHNGPIKIIQHRFPGKVVSYKSSNLEQRKRASIICFHGKPRPKDLHWSWE